MTDTSSSKTHPAELLKKSNIDPSNEEVNVDKTKEESESSMSMPVIRPRPRVSFSDKSSLNIYKNYRDELHRSNIAYSLQDRDLFNREATQEADRIKALITNAPQKSRVDSVKYLLKNKIVSKEELVGIEHLALEKSNKWDIRKSHSIAVLMKQQEQQRQNLPLQDPTIALSKFARKISLESRNIARARAALAVSQTQTTHLQQLRWQFAIPRSASGGKVCFKQGKTKEKIEVDTLGHLSLDVNR